MKDSYIKRLVEATCDKPVPVVLPTQNPNFYDNDGKWVYGESKKPSVEPTFAPYAFYPTKYPVTDPTFEPTDYPIPNPTERAIIGITNHGTI